MRRWNAHHTCRIRPAGHSAQRHKGGRPRGRKDSRGAECPASLIPNKRWRIARPIRHQLAATMSAPGPEPWKSGSSYPRHWVADPTGDLWANRQDGNTATCPLPRAKQWPRNVYCAVYAQSRPPPAPHATAHPAPVLSRAPIGSGWRKMCRPCVRIRPAAESLLRIGRFPPVPRLP